MGGEVGMPLLVSAGIRGTDLYREIPLAHFSILYESAELPIRRLLRTTNAGY